MKKNHLLIITLFFITAMNAQVGIGTTNPDAMLHIKGTTVPGGGGGSTIDLINEDFTGYTISQSHTSDASCTTTDGWITTTSAPAAYVCTGCTGTYLYIDSDDSGCDQDATVLMNFTPSETTINISFDYRLNSYLGGETFRVYLFDGTAQVGADLVNTSSDVNTTYGPTAHTVVSGLAHTLRFEYLGSYDYGVTFDNVLIQETSSGGSGGTYMFRLEDGQQQDGYVMTSDADGYATWKVASGGGGADQTLSISGNDLTISGPGGNTVTIPSSGGGGGHPHENGITLSGGTVRLGGDLTQATYIDLLTHDLWFEGTSTGDIVWEGNNRIVMQTNFGDDYVNFGAGGAFVDSDDGTTFLDTYGIAGIDDFTKDFLVGYYNGSSGGSAIAMGSIEYFVDGTDELFLEASNLSPMSNLGADLGADPFTGTTRMWDDVYADDFITPTNTYSRSTNKTADLNQRGLAEIMLLKPISYLDNTMKMGKTVIPENLKNRKLGFYAEELLQVVPEAVKTSDWVSLDESGKKTHIIFDTPKGIMPYQLIPVTVKAIQEQQLQIEELKAAVQELKEQNKLLRNLIDKIK